MPAAIDIDQHHQPAIVPCNLAIAKPLSTIDRGQRLLAGVICQHKVSIIGTHPPLQLLMINQPQQHQMEASIIGYRSALAITSTWLASLISAWSFHRSEHDQNYWPSLDSVGTATLISISASNMLLASAIIKIGDRESIGLGSDRMILQHKGIQNNAKTLTRINRRIRVEHKSHVDG